MTQNSSNHQQKQNKEIISCFWPGCAAIIFFNYRAQTEFMLCSDAERISRRIDYTCWQSTTMKRHQTHADEIPWGHNCKQHWQMLFLDMEEEKHQLQIRAVDAQEIWKHPQAVQKNLQVGSLCYLLNRGENDRKQIFRVCGSHKVVCKAQQEKSKATLVKYARSI